MMRFACLTAVAPGTTLAAQCAAIAEGGCQGIEALVLPSTPLERWVAEARAATADAGLDVAAVIIGGLALYGPLQQAYLEEVMHAVAELGAVALVTAEYRAQDPLPLFPPYPAPSDAERQNVREAVGGIAILAAWHGVTVALEPVTQFESRLWREVDGVLDLCHDLAMPHVGVALDFHNMNITERTIEASIVRSGNFLKHVHLADNNRRLPGYGHIDWSSGLQAVSATGYDGYYSFECAVGDDFAAELRQATALVRRAASGATP